MDPETITLGKDEGQIINEPEVKELDEEASDLEKARATVGAAEGEDPLAALLNWDESIPIQDTWYSKRLKADFTLQALTEDGSYESLLERATNYVRRRGGGRQREIDNRKLSRLLVMEGVINPPLHPQHGAEGFAKLAKKYKTEIPEVLIGRVLLPGEIDQIAEKVLELSGYDDDLEEAAGN